MTMDELEKLLPEEKVSWDTKHIMFFLLWMGIREHWTSFDELEQFMDMARFYMHDKQMLCNSEESVV